MMFMREREGWFYDVLHNRPGTHTQTQDTAAGLKTLMMMMFIYCCSRALLRRRTLKSTLHPTIFWEMVKFVDLGVLYFSLVLPV